MKISYRHMFHGAALIQIAEHPAFTAINAFRYQRAKSTNAYAINDNVGVYLKYASKPHGKHREYKFTFSREHLEEIAAIKAKQERAFVALVCWKVAEVCCIPERLLRTLIKERRERIGRREESYTLYVRAPAGAGFRVYVSPPGEKGYTLGETVIPRNAFPSCLFANRKRRRK